MNPDMCALLDDAMVEPKEAQGIEMSGGWIGFAIVAVDFTDPHRHLIELACGHSTYSAITTTRYTAGNPEVCPTCTTAYRDRKRGEKK